MRFEQRLRDGIHSGAVVLAFRRWKRSQVVAGHQYRTGTDMVEVTTVLAEAMGWERQDFKLHVRRLKELGLTLSLNIIDALKDSYAYLVGNRLSTGRTPVDGPGTAT